MSYKRIIDHKTIMDDLVNNIAPIYFNLSDTTKYRASIFGLQMDWNARATEDTVLLEQKRAEDYCPELSSNEIHVRQTARIRNIPINNAKPATCYAQISILKDDIHNKGTVISTSERQFIIDKRSTIVNNGISFSLESDILIREIMRKNGSYVYTANYIGDELEYQTYIQVFDDINEEHEDVITLVVIIYQRNYNIQEKVVTNELEFLIDGIEFDYDNLLAGFDVYYKRSNESSFTKIDTKHHLINDSNGNSSPIFYHDDDDDNILIIKNSEFSGIGLNTIIRVEIQETLGTEGMKSIGSQPTSFELFRDNSYSYTGIHIEAELISDPSNARDKDTLDQLKERLIREKTTRNNITTMLDIINFVNDGYADYNTSDHNVQVVKKRNDLIDNRYYIYTLLRLNGEICPTSTKNFRLTDLEFDIVREGSQRKCVKANHRYQLHVVQNVSADLDYVTICDAEQMLLGADTDELSYFVNIPFLMVFDRYNTMQYYFNSINQRIPVSTVQVNEEFPYQIIAKECVIRRNAVAQENDDVYTLSIEGTLNTSNDLGIIDAAGNIIDKNRILAYAIFKDSGTNVAYMILNLSGYDPTNRNRSFTFTGSFKTNDFITEDDKLEIIDGLYAIGTTDKYSSVIDFKDGIIELGFLYNETGDEKISDSYTARGVYSTIPNIGQYTLMNVYRNSSDNPYNLIIEMSKITSSPVIISRPENSIGDNYVSKQSPSSNLSRNEESNSDEVEETNPENVDEPQEIKYLYEVKEAPLIEYLFSVENIYDIYDEIYRMYLVYNSLIKKTTNFDISLKFIATYGQSKYITVTGGRDEYGNEIDLPLANLTPTLRFRVYSANPNVDDIRTFIYEYFRDNYITPKNLSEVMEGTISPSVIFMSNICSLVENKFSYVRSIKYLGVDNFDASFQQFTYNKPAETDIDGIIRYIPEQLNINNIEIDIEETR